MKSFGLRIAAVGLLCCESAWIAGGQDAQKPAYLNPSLPAEQRAAGLVHRMKLEEKATQLVNQARAIPRLGVPAYDWWSESLHGVAEGAYSVSVGGGQSGTGAPVVAGSFSIQGTITLPE